MNAKDYLNKQNQREINIEELSKNIDELIKDSKKNDELIKILTKKVEDSIVNREALRNFLISMNDEICSNIRIQHNINNKKENFLMRNIFNILILFILFCVLIFQTFIFFNLKSQPKNQKVIHQNEKKEEPKTLKKIEKKLPKEKTEKKEIKNTSEREKEIEKSINDNVSESFIEPIPKKIEVIGNEPVSNVLYTINSAKKIKLNNVSDEEVEIQDYKINNSAKSLEILVKINSEWHKLEDYKFILFF